ncbi:hypothetical protein P153DRAFT_361641 [Dothidotthia symphoricarpi CBS 119687]|uniref:Uncharacterized protein n=1 Tax=Dothidotthia symphoricarpi CBS 119687 TaxID=1392245 RepID=A0A6A5ZWR4_9PLEO|nr:uncharacterized protein P153DRAFT_361641 [Dothidotthia symphoricarpi CBS 119687]KAF2124020.1 hypothetical protein P153DRAFT_361641 [Dothidotthia symphoricarpi CBS 119687]
MPSFRANYMPTVIQSKPSSPKKGGVFFPKDPVASISRPVNTTESWAAHDFEMHASKCVYCHDPYEVHRNREQLCDAGHRLAQEVAKYIYNKSDGATYSTIEEGSKLIRVEVPAGYVEVSGLLKAIERSLRHRTRKPFVSMDRSYYVAPRAPTLPSRSRSVKVEQEPRTKTSSRPRSGEIVDWPEKPKTQPKPRALAEITNSMNAKRGSLYEEDLAKQRRNAKRYSVEVREPTQHDLREHRLAGYYR